MSGAACPVMVVEDDADSRDSLREVLQAEGYVVRTAVNGQDALVVLSGAERPCLILLDLMMPVMDGAEFLSRKKESRDIATIPVVVVSAWPDQALKMADTQGVVSKPIVLDNLIAYVEKYCEAHERKRE